MVLDAVNEGEVEGNILSVEMEEEEIDGECSELGEFVCRKEVET